MAHPPDRALARAITDVLREARGRGMTTRDIADYFGVSDATISRWEAGARQPALDLLPAFDRLAGQERGYVLRRAGYVDELVTVTADGFKLDMNDPDEIRIWGLTGIPEDRRRRWIERYREINAEPPPPAARKAPPRKRRKAG
jgi:transcriptional regulator with XRE-family HTH domain